MQIAATNDFAAPPEKVYAMLSDPAFLEAVCRATDPIEFEVWVRGRSTGTRRVLPAPSSVTAITGPTITVRDEIAWAEETAAGTRSGVTTIAVEGLPVHLNGTVTLGPTERGSRLSYAGLLTVNIPLFGPKLARQAAPALLEALAVQERVGADFLAARSD